MTHIHATPYQPTTARLSCDMCGDDLAELRAIRRDGWCPDEITCAPCFAARDGENDFTLLEMAQEADHG